MAAVLWPIDGTRARTVAVVPWATSLLIPVWSSGIAWVGNPLTQNSLSLAAVTGVSGYAGAAADGASGAWLVQTQGTLQNYASGGAVSNFTLPTTGIFAGAAYSPTQNTVYVINSSGQVYAPSGVGVVAVGTPFASPPAFGLTASGSQLFTMLGAVTGIGVFSLSATGAGTSGIVNISASGLLCLAASSPVSAWAVGAFTYATIPSGFTSLGIDPFVITNLLGASPTGNSVSLYVGSGDSWSFSSTVTGITGAQNLAWVPNGLNILVTFPASGIVTVLTYNAGVITVSGTLSVTGAAGVAVTPDSGWALVAQGSQNQVGAIQNNGGVFTASGSFVASGATAVAVIGSGNAYVAVAGGINQLVYATGAAPWAASSSVTGLPFTPTSVIFDASGAVYAVGTSGASGFLSIFTSGRALQQTLSWAGAGSGVLFEQDQVVVGDPANQVLRIFGPVSGTPWNATTTIPAPAGVGALAVSFDVVFAAGGSGVSEYQFVGPFNLAQLRIGQVFVFGSGGVTGVANLGVSHWPTAMVFDVSGNLRVATLQNDLYSVGVSGANPAAILSQTSVPQYPKQPQSTPLGMSSLVIYQHGLYAGTSMPGTLIQIAASGF